MKITRLALTAVLFTSIVTACDDDDEVMGVGVADLVGTWEATSAVFTSNVDPSITVDAVPLGGSATLTVTVDGRFTLITVLPGAPAEIDTGIIVSITVDTMTLLFDNEPNNPEAVNFTLSGNTLTITSDDFAFDFGMGDVSASAAIVFQRT